MNPPTPAGRLVRMLGHLREARGEAAALILKTQETQNLTLQREAAWFKLHITELIERGEELLLATKPSRKGRRHAPQG